MLNNYIIRGDCWLWQGAIDRDGYGKVKYKNRMEQAHRIIYILTHNLEIDSSIHIHHDLCKNTNCVNPAHMKMVEAGLHNKIHKSKINSELGQKIIELYKTTPAYEVGWKLGLSCATVTKYLKELDKIKTEKVK